MEKRNMIVLLLIAGFLGVLAGLWSGGGVAVGIGPIRQGPEPISHHTEDAFMALAVMGGVAALAMGLFAGHLSSKVLGFASLISGALMIPSLFQGNILSLAAMSILFIAGVTSLISPAAWQPGAREVKEKERF